MYNFCHCLTKPIITRIIVSLVLENVIIRIEVTVFRDFITLVKYVQILSFLTKPIITRIIVSLMFKNVIIRIEVTVFRDFITLVKYVQILSMFNQAHYYTNYFFFNV